MTITDQLGRIIPLAKMPARIVSLVPSQTEFLYEIGLGDQIVGQTLFCIHPEDKFKKATKVGGTKKLQLDKIRNLRPDIIIANREENEQAQIEALAREFPVWISDVKTIDDALDMMQKLGQILGKEAESDAIVNELKKSFQDAKKTGSTLPKTALYLIWQKPWMAVGRDTFINDMMQIAGFENVITETDSRYPKVFLKDIEDYHPDYVFLSSEPFPFSEIHVAEMQELLPDSIIKLVDGEMFSWYGSRIDKAFHYFKTLNN